MVLPLPGETPLTLDWLTIQLNVVPLTPFGLVMDKFAVSPEQMDKPDGVMATVGLGFTVATTVVGVLEHPLAVAVTV